MRRQPRAGNRILRILPRPAPLLVVSILVLGTIAASVVAFFVVPGLVVDDSRFKPIAAADRAVYEEKRLKARNDARTVTIQLIAAVAVVVGGAFTWRTVWLTREGQITDRFAKAIEQLQHEPQEKESRVGAIYALGRVARDSRADHAAVLAVLADHLRKYSPAVNEHGQPLELGARHRVDPEVQAVAMVLRHRRAHWDPQETRVDLSAIDFRLAPLQGVDLRGADLKLANFRGAYLSDGDLRHTLLVNACLENANLQRARLDDANASGANFEFAHASKAKMRRVDFEEASFGETEFYGANLKGACGLPPRERELIQGDAKTIWP